ncbi:MULTISPECIES: site-specific tyrosine recombinase XerC [Lonsdalea]|uniref:Recombinase XerD n=4 Tax=Lonsdalea TaxID=1082702 RepID=A0ACD1J8R0_9GAMM|nr:MULTISPECIES: site-specific tyrosine recombinase XerC [Lonsdalea]OSM94035.1 recombinase XerD [Lonsdalea populi]QPQ23882.1 site-specific tyrosine recombinase XerC [Lonsdalea populi]QPQ23887.1 site-specific tyrosine recombinase XerC [Lonsdalea populi]RAT10088.1 recombinase XerD [Lonsdalea quercina]RAT16569.1 recombinase XerD [Lonsdalea populi]
MSQPKPPSPEALYLSRQTQTLRQHTGHYLDHLSAAGYSARTHEGYRERLLPFVAWCEDRGLRYAPQVSLAVLEGYQRWLRSYRKADGKPLAAGSQLGRLTGIRMLFRWLLRRHVILYNPAEMLTLPKEERRLPAQVLSVEETGGVLQSVESGTVIGLRNRVILEVLWSSGIRRAEAASLMLSDIDLSRGVMAVRQGKGNKDRVVPLGERAGKWLERYLNHARPELAKRYDSGHLFISHKGKGLARVTLTQMAGKAIRGTGHLDKPGACHVFRHSMATQMLENGADTRHIQAILGHEKLETTQIYTRVAIGHLQKVHGKTHPAERRQTARRKKKRDERRPDTTTSPDNNKK